MTDDSNIGTMLAVAGLFAITFYLLRDPVGDAESAIIAAASCTGLTGATLAACQKAQPKPKPITPAKPKPQGITAARPRGITPATPSKVRTQKSISSGAGGGVGGPRTSAFNCRMGGGVWSCERRIGVPENQSCRCLRPISPTNLLERRKQLARTCAAKVYEQAVAYATSKFKEGWQQTQFINKTLQNAARTCGAKFGVVINEQLPESFKPEFKAWNPYEKQEYCKSILSNVCRFDTSSAACRYCSTAIPT